MDYGIGYYTWTYCYIHKCVCYKHIEEEKDHLESLQILNVSFLLISSL